MFVATGTREFEVAAIPAEVVDTTGARGNSFNAGFLSRFVCGEDLEACAEAGVLAAVTKRRRQSGRNSCFRKLES